MDSVYIYIYIYIYIREIQQSSEPGPGCAELIMGTEVVVQLGVCLPITTAEVGTDHHKCCKNVVHVTSVLLLPYSKASEAVIDNRVRVQCFLIT